MAWRTAQVYEYIQSVYLAKWVYIKAWMLETSRGWDLLSILFKQLKNKHHAFYNKTCNV